MGETSTLVALLRGVNVGNRRLAMADVRHWIDDDGLGPSRTHLASGNVVLPGSAAAVAGGRAALAARLSDVVERHAGFAVPVTLRDADELRAMVDANPFPEVAAREPKLLHVHLLGSVPADGRDLDAARATVERWRRVGAELYVHYAAGSARSKLTADHVERALGVTTTARAWPTVVALTDLAAAASLP